MKTLIKNKEVKRVKDSDADKLVLEKGWKFCSKYEWKKVRKPEDMIPIEQEVVKPKKEKKNKKNKQQEVTEPVAQTTEDIMSDLNAVKEMMKAETENLKKKDKKKNKK